MILHPVTLLQKGRSLCDISDREKRFLLVIYDALPGTQRLFMTAAVRVLSSGQRE
jgi:hypothetical protein